MHLDRIGGGTVGQLAGSVYVLNALGLSEINETVVETRRVVESGRSAHQIVHKRVGHIGRIVLRVDLIVHLVQLGRVRMVGVGVRM
ncbi:hypothetical protein BpHYR1_003799 [Brachionus plicatilis]|uniref:Uncharacterized protein n=1 Tax=Brachionus plicatilis TaxID=10195 RepID=A0A3M7RP97_BRAPC|nr:hypothetical protein BpHYR1_003799 [Brachionus plicatilis]